MYDFKIEDIEWEFIVVKDAGTYEEEIFYTGNNELEAFKNYHRIKAGKRNIFKAEIERIKINNVDFIKDYEIIQIVK